MSFVHGYYSRSSIENTPNADDRPLVRVRFDCDYIDEDGRTTSGTRETEGRILVDGNNPWVQIWAGGRSIAERFSWGLVLEVVNDPHAAPVYFSRRVAYEV